VINKEILNNFYHACHFMMIGQFTYAGDRYLEIAIGNKAWPIGINVLGVHERTGKSRIFCSYILRELIRPHKQQGPKAIPDCLQATDGLHRKTARI